METDVKRTERGYEANVTGEFNSSSPAESRDFPELYRKAKTWKLGSDLGNLRAIEEICESLEQFGLSRNETRVYVYLAKFGEQKAHKISKSLSIHRTETYKILKKLEEKSLVLHVLERPLKFSAVRIDKALENLIQARKQNMFRLEEEKRRIVNRWASLSVPTENTETPDEFIQVLKGRNQIHIKANEITQNAEDEVMIAVSSDVLFEMFYSGALDRLALKSDRIKIRLITDSSLRSSDILEKLRFGRDEFSYLSFSDFPSFIISGNNLLLFLDDENKNDKRALWTNQKEMIKALRASFSVFQDKSAVLNPAIVEG